MTENKIITFEEIAARSLLSPEGQKWLEACEMFLYKDINNGKFNTERAVELYRQAIEQAVQNLLGGPNGYTMIKVLRSAGVSEKIATEYTNEFKKKTGAIDQRPSRKGVWAKIVGK